ncbi:60Kd inner membrane protein-domain-containing protein [Kockovaella imperatae]|uniref:60Kd inner membrane protein-domain-containing protein n=1 Tax=Kockovaella imperatae TaxID=4999 RepID=A0A1Y1UI67_9TREE|nr:60Kd inner membrane protein-domain-containing protein [Kockovaella imperatae]ORX37712.1 60Kd inner membrane protein-domain-containing protein [Kockovaella imperatae]
MFKYFDLGSCLERSLRAVAMASSGAAAVRYALRTTLAPRLVHSSSAATAAFVHLSPNALGKRPEVWVTAQRRHFSWTPWKASSDTVDATAIETSTPSAASSSSAIPTATSSADNLSNAIDKAASSSSQTSITDAISNNTGAAVDAVNDAVSSTATTATTSNIASSASESTYLPGETLSTIIANNLGSSSSASAESLKSLLTSPEAVAAPATVADLASVGLGHKWYSLFGWATDFLISAHNFTGLPWWATIIGVNIFIRLILLRVLIPSIKHSHRWAATIPEQAALSARQKAATAAGNQKEAMAALLQMRKLWSEHDIHPLRSISLPVVQGATFFVFFVAIRRMATTPWPQFVDGGFGWVQNLTIPDPYYILPLTSALATIAVIRTVPISHKPGQDSRFTCPISLP